MEFKIERQQDKHRKKREIDVLFVRTHNSEDWEAITWKDLGDLVFKALMVETKNKQGGKYEGRLKAIEPLIDSIIEYFFRFDKTVCRRIDLTHKKLIKRMMRDDGFDLELRLKLAHFFEQQGKYWKNNLPTEENLDKQYRERNDSIKLIPEENEYTEKELEQLKEVKN